MSGPKNPDLGDSTPPPFVVPYVHYMPDKYQGGANSFADNVTLMRAADWDTLWATHYDTDAHFVCYQMPGDAELPRSNKPLVHHIRARGGDLMMTMFVFDWDTDGHLPITDVSWMTMFQKLQSVAQEWEPALKFNILYTTRNGLRLVYLLDRPIKVDQAEGMHRWFVQQFGAHGITLDPLSDWTRVFRLPYVTRDKRPTWMDDREIQFFNMGVTPFPVSEIGTVGDTRGNRYAEIVPITTAKPTPEIVGRLLYLVKGTGQNIPSEFYKTAKRLLRGRECFTPIFEMSSLAPAGRRNDTIHRYVGQAIGVLYSQEGMSPEHIYSLFYDSVLQLTPDRDTPDWTEILWSAVARLWAKEAAKIAQVAIADEDKAKQMLNLAGSIAEGMRKWCPASDLRDPRRCVEFVQRHLIVSAGPSYFVIQPDGYYDPSSLKPADIIPVIRARGLDELIVTRTQNDAGGWTDRPIQSVLNEFATVVSEVWAAPGEGGAFITNIDTPQAQITLPAFWRNTTLKPEYNFNVDTWLKFLGEKNYNLLIRWIAYALDMESGPICALSIRGPAGSGKKMLVRGLAECLKLPRVATSEDMIGDNNYGLLQSPFLSVDEGWVKPGRGRHPADQFRGLVAGDTFTIKRKYMAPCHITNCVRVIFTANNLDVVRVLTYRRELSPEDRDALAQRLLHFDITDAAAVWLKDRGGVKFTGKTGERWIMGDGGEESDYVVAKHFLWLYEKRRELGEPGARFLVEGNADKDIMMELRTGAGSSPLVVECILSMLDKRATWEGLAIVDDRLYLSAGEVLNFYRQNMRDAVRTPLTADNINNAFRGISLSGDVKPYRLKTREALGPRRWHEMDCKILLEVAERDSWKCDKLRELVAKQTGVIRVVDGSTEPPVENVQNDVDTRAVAG